MIQPFLSLHNGRSADLQDQLATERDALGFLSERYRSGWWFGCHEFYVPIGNLIIPSDELIFLRGVETTNQRC